LQRSDFSALYSRDYSLLADFWPLRNRLRVVGYNTDNAVAKLGKQVSPFLTPKDGSLGHAVPDEWSRGVRSRFFFALVLSASLLANEAAHAQSFAPVWSDEFEGPANARPDPKKWVYDIGFGNALWGNNEAQTYTSQPGNVRLDGNGHLVITARKEADGRYTSARIKTKGRFALRYGRFETRLKIPRGPGLLPAFWLMGNAGQWPANGEIDIMENVGNSPATVFSNLHAPGYTGAGSASISGELSADYHTYAIEWLPGRISWQLDGHTYKTVTSLDIPPGSKWIFDAQPFYMLLNVAVGGDWPGKPDDTRLPAEMDVDWVRVSAYVP
jgi:beta-glucanase (GH16 family)